MKKTVFVLLLLVVVGAVGFKLGEKSGTNRVIASTEKKTVIGLTPAPSDKSEFDTSFDTNQEYYYSFFKNKGLTITSFNYENLNGEGSQAVFDTIGTGCGSCHYNEIHIFDGRKEIFVFYGEDSSLTPINGKGFKITQPVLKEGQSYAERNEMEWAIYQWDGKSFVKSKTSPNWIDEPQTPG